MREWETPLAGDRRDGMQDYRPKEDDYGDGDIPEIDTEPYKNGAYVESPPHQGSAGGVESPPHQGSAGGVESPPHQGLAGGVEIQSYRNAAESGESMGCVEGLPESSRPRRDGPGGE